MFEDPSSLALSLLLAASVLLSSCLFLSVFFVTSPTNMSLLWLLACEAGCGSRVNCKGEVGSYFKARTDSKKKDISRYRNRNILAEKERERGETNRK